MEHKELLDALNAIQNRAEAAKTRLDQDALKTAWLDVKDHLNKLLQIVEVLREEANHLHEGDMVMVRSTGEIGRVLRFSHPAGGALAFVVWLDLKSGTVKSGWYQLGDLMGPTSRGEV